MLHTGFFTPNAWHERGERVQFGECSCSARIDEDITKTAPTRSFATSVALADATLSVFLESLAVFEILFDFALLVAFREPEEEEGAAREAAACEQPNRPRHQDSKADVFAEEVQEK
jgi:hypothetical protein